MSSPQERDESRQSCTMRYAGSSTIYYVQLLIIMSSNLVLQSTVGI